MRKKRYSELRVDRQILSYDGKVFPLRNIAYFEKSKLKRKTGIGKILLLTVLVLAAVVVASAANDYGIMSPFITPGVLFLGIVYLVWITYLIRRRDRYALVLQTNAGDSPRLLTSHDEQSLDKLISAVATRLEPGTESPPLIYNINDNSIIDNSLVDNSITVGDVAMGDQFNVNDNTGQIGQIGSHSIAHDINFIQKWNQVQGNIDLHKLAAELATLSQQMKESAVEAGHYTALAKVKEAEEAAASADGAKVLEHLKSAGAGALETAKKIGSRLVVETIELAMSL